MNHLCKVSSAVYKKFRLNTRRTKRNLVSIEVLSFRQVSKTSRIIYDFNGRLDFVSKWCISSKLQLNNQCVCVQAIPPKVRNTHPNNPIRCEKVCPSSVSEKTAHRHHTASVLRAGLLVKKISHCEAEEEQSAAAARHNGSIVRVRIETERNQ